MTLGANVKEQGICFLICLAVGLAVGIFALLYLRVAVLPTSVKIYRKHKGKFGKK